MKRIALFVAGLAAVAALVAYAGFGAVTQALATLGPLGLLAIAALHLVVIAGLGLAWWRVSPGTQRRRTFVLARLIRDSAAELLPFSQLGGFAIGVRALALSGVDVFRGALSMFADLTMEFAAKLPYAMVGLVLLFALLPGAPLIAPFAAGVAGAGAVFAALLVYREKLFAALERAALAVVRRWTGLAPEGDIRPVIAAAFQSRGLAACFAIHFACWLFGAAETWVMFRLLNVEITLTEAIVIDSLANGLRTFAFFIPVAAGVQEGAYVLVGAWFGISPASALAFSLARRARDAVLGLPALAAWQGLEASRPVQVAGGKDEGRCS